MNLSEREISIAEWAEVTACPLCSSGRSWHSAFSSLRADPYRLHYRICRNCGLVFQSPRLEAAALEAYYRDEYHQRLHSRESAPEKDRWVQRRRSDFIAMELSKRQPEASRHLDVGSSSGILMQVIAQAFGSESLGVELNETERGMARALGYTVVPTLADLPADYQNSFDLVTMSHVLEHLPDPLGILRTLYDRWMKPGGLLAVEVPNLYGHTAFEIGHLTAFTPTSLRQALSRAGFGVETLRIHGRPYSRLLPLFLLALARSPGADAPEAFPTPSLWSIKARRMLGMILLKWTRFLGKKLLAGSKRRPWQGG